MDNAVSLDKLEGMYSPPERDEELGLDVFRLELAQALHESPEVRAFYGLVRGEDGSFMIVDLPKIRAFNEDIKSVLRAFLKANGRKLCPPEPLKAKAEEVGIKGKMTPKIRADLDALYRHLDELRYSAKPRRIQI